jgi:undecaprenyl phosphate-alpha-L-ara4N flippase subunit ArnE
VVQGERARILLVMLVAVIALAIGEIALSKGMKASARESSGLVAVASAALRSPWLWLGVGLLVVHLGLYLAVLSEADLSFALPLTAASYPLGALLAKVVLHEEIGLARWAGTALITVGVAVVAFCEGAVRSEP